jgi:hypothetical protein
MAFKLQYPVLAITLVLCCSVAALAQAPKVDVAGVWKGSFETQMGAMETTITLQAGAGVAGTVKIGEEMEGKIENGRLDGDKISFDVTIGPGKLAFDGTVAGDEMKLTVTGTTGNKYPMTCKRQK